MFVFAMFMFFALGVMIAAMFIDSLLNLARELRAVVLAGIGIGLAWAVDFNLWSLWHLHARRQWLAVTLTGLFLAGGAYFWHVLLGFFSGLLRKYHDEAATLEKTQQIYGPGAERPPRLSLRRTQQRAG
jgi:hypothetical protein